MKILITGNPKYGIAKALNDVFPMATFISRSRGFDLSDSEVIMGVALKSLDFDVVINNSRGEAFRQTELLSEIATVWIKHSKNGKIINIGSVADRFIRSLNSYKYSSEKSSLKHLSRQLHYCHAHKRLPFSSTYIAFGHVDTRFGLAYRNDSIKKMTAKHCAETIQWVINNPLAIEEIRIEPVQE